MAGKSGASSSATSGENDEYFTAEEDNVYNAETEVSTYSADILASLKNLRVENTLCDVTIVVQDRSFPAHKNILVAASDYFRAMFTTTYEENTKTEVVLEKTPALAIDSFSQLVDFIYTGKLHLSMETVLDIIRCASYLQISAGVQACCAFIAESFDKKVVAIDDYLKISNTAGAYGIDALKELANSHIARRFEDVCKTDGFMESISVKTLLDLLRRDDLMVTSESELFNVVKTWLEFDWTQRQEHAKELFGTVRLGCLTVNDIRQGFQGKIKESLDCRDIYDALLMYQVTKEPNDIFSLFPNKEDIAQPRNNVKGLLAVGTGNMYILHESKLEKTNLINEMCNAGVETANRTLFIAGGNLDDSYDDSDDACEFDSYHAYKNYQTDAKFVRLDMQAGGWIELPSMSVSRAFLSLIHLEGYLYAIGGVERSNTEFCKMVERYSIEQRIWQKCASLELPHAIEPYRSNNRPSVLIYQRHIIFCAMEASTTKSWSRNMIVPASKALVLNVSKYDDANPYASRYGDAEYTRNMIVMAFNPSTNKWITLPSCKVIGDQMHIITTNNSLYMVSFGKVQSRFNESRSWQWSPTVCRYVLNQKQKFKPEDQSCLPESKFPAFRIGPDVYIFINGHVIKTDVSVTKGQVYDADLDQYNWVSQIESNAKVVQFSLPRKYLA